MRRWLARRDRAELLGVGLLAGLLVLLGAPPLVMSFAVSPEAIERGEVQLTPPCPTLERTGEPCPTCGMTRGVCAMSRLRCDQAVTYNGAVPYLYCPLWGATATGAALLTGVLLEARRRSGGRRALAAYAKMT